jgi:hypothetical protein
MNIKRTKNNEENTDVCAIISSGATLLQKPSFENESLSVVLMITNATLD